MMPTSDALVFFGATGDLAYKQIFPALYAMVRRQKLAAPIIGVAKSGWGVEELRARARASVEASVAKVDPAALERLLAQLDYHDGDYADPATFAALRTRLGDARHPLHYLAIPPSLFERVVAELARSGCAQGARVVVEKPFGHDLGSAQALNRALLAVFAEEDVFRIDHYLGKEAVQNLVVFRFGNRFLEPIWNRQHVESVQITMAESIGIAGRGAFYDQTGAVRDVVQNHLMQILGILTMEPAASAKHEALRDQIGAALEKVRPIDPAEHVLGQLVGYRDEAGVAPDSRRETFAALRLHVDSPRWHGVPFLARAGKRLPIGATEIVVQLKPAPMQHLAPPGSGNRFRFRLSPEIFIGLRACVKQPGEVFRGVPDELSLVHHPSDAEMTAYERLLGDAMVGDLTLFAREDAVEAAWKIVTPILDGPTAPLPYASGTWGPPEADTLAAELGGWNDPR